MLDRRAPRHLRGASRVIVNIPALTLKSGTCTNQTFVIHPLPSPVPYATHSTYKIPRTHVYTGNAAILKGGKESARTAAELSRTIQVALARTALPGAFIQTVETRAEVTALLSQDKYIDSTSTSHPAWGQRASARDPAQYADTGDGSCRLALRDIIYLDESADSEKVKARRGGRKGLSAVAPSTHFHSSHSPPVDRLPRGVQCSGDAPSPPKPAQDDLAGRSGSASHSTVDVKLLCDESTLSALTSSPSKKTDNHTNFQTHVLPAPPEAYTTEHLSLTLAVHTVPSLAATIAHINEHGSHHTNGIITESTSPRVGLIRQHVRAQR
jgi:glutamate-5-semialdehyde dehydrogenase